MSDATPQERERPPKNCCSKNWHRKKRAPDSGPSIFPKNCELREYFDLSSRSGATGAAGDAERIKRGKGGEGRKTSGTAAAAKKESRGEHVTKSRPPGRERDRAA